MIEEVKYLRRLLKKHFRERQKSAKIKSLISKLENNKEEKPILLNGFPKSGNTWTRFIIFNYFNIRINKSESTLTFKELEKISPHILGLNEDLDFTPDFPPFYRSHQSEQYIQKAFKFFRIIFLYRHPLDCLISYFHWKSERVNPFAYYPPSERDKLKNVNYFVRYEIGNWINHYVTLFPRSDYVLSYESMKDNPIKAIGELFTVLNIPLDEATLIKAIELSTAENIRSMGRITGQRTGGMNKGFVKDYEFVRSGKVGQYHFILSDNTIDYVNKLLSNNKIHIPEYY